jgi:preprotein translocase subunit SecG
MLAFIGILLIIIAALLIILVLLQPGKGDMASSLGALSGQFNSILGTRRTADLLQKLTIGFAAGIMVLTLMANILFSHHEDQGVEKTRTIMEDANFDITPNGTPARQAAPGQQQQAAGQKQQQNQQQPQQGSAQKK